MDAVAAHLSNRLACLITAALGAAITLSIVLSVCLPGTADLHVVFAPGGTRVVDWLAPNGPAWSIGIRPGDQLLPTQSRSGPDRAVVIARSRSTGRLLTLRTQEMEAGPLDLVVGLLGLGFLCFGLAVLVRSAARGQAAAFWLVCMALGSAMGFVPAGYHGVLFALPLDFIGLRCLGPALLGLALVFPHRTHGSRRQLLLWLPALVLMALYAVSWRYPAPLFDRMRVADDLELTIYLLAACMVMIGAAARPHSAQERAQRRILTIGVVGGAAPFAIFTILPLMVTRHALVPAEVTILATALMPISIGIAIVRDEFLGIPSLMRRRTFHVVVWTMLPLGGAAGGGFLAVVGPQRWGWPLPVSVATIAGLCTLGGALFWPRLRGSAGRLVLKDEYDTVEVLHELSAEVVSAGSEVIGPYVVARLSRVLNLQFALLLTREDQWSHSHVRNPLPSALQEAIARRARSILAAGSPMGIAMESILGVPVLILALGKRADVLAAICLGPKRGGDCFTRQDQQFLHAFGSQLAVALGKVPTITRREPRAVRTLASAEDRVIDHHEGRLTRFEVGVLTLVAQGLSNKEIAKQLGRETRTVEKHLTNVFRRLGAQNRMDAVATARRLNLLPVEHVEASGE